MSTPTSTDVDYAKGKFPWTTDPTLARTPSTSPSNDGASDAGAIVSSPATGSATRSYSGASTNSTDSTKRAEQPISPFHGPGTYFSWTKDYDPRFKPNSTTGSGSGAEYRSAMTQTETKPCSGMCNHCIGNSDHFMEI